MDSAKRPLLGITMGDPGSIGPEICAKALASEAIYRICRPLVIGEAEIIRRAVKYGNLKSAVHACETPLDGKYAAGTIDVLHQNAIDVDAVKMKTVTPEQGRASFAYVAKAIDLALEGRIDGTVTGPINKAAINAGGYAYAGHTEIYAHLTRTRDYAMMLVEGHFRVTHVSTHVSLREACDRVKTPRVKTVIGLTHRALTDMGLRDVKIAVAGLNPHCGESGLFGTEDDEEILPAVESARKEGIPVEGPIPADTVFPKMKGGMYDAVVVMYHDQGHIPTKLLGFQYNEASGSWSQMAGINVTLGLPIIRTSVDHGTAFDIAGEGKANAQSMTEAIRVAAMLSKGR